MTPLVLLAASLLGVPETAADAITLRDGKIILGQVAEPSPKGKLLVIVRRSWAEKALPDRFRAWKTAEAPTLKRAKAERMTRLEAWKRDRPNVADDPIAPWIDAEIARLKSDVETPPLMLVTLSRNDVKVMTRRSPEVGRKLRLAWKVKFDDAETKPVADLASALEGRGFAPDGTAPVVIDDLLPVAPEPESRWLARRAATEVAHDKSLRFIRASGLLMPENAAAGGAPDPLASVNSLVKSLLNDGPAEDPMEAKGREITASGRVGMLVTSLETAEDASGVTVEVVLFARTAPDRWERVAARTSRFRADEVRDGDNAIIANDPQVKGVLKAAEGFGIAVPEDVKRKGLAVGAATQKALAAARTSIQPDLDALELPIGAAKK